MALTYPKKYEKDINLKTWNKAIIDFAKAKPQDLNGFLLHRIAHYKDSKYENTILWYCMKEDFIRWTKKTWTLIKREIVRNFYNFLQENRVFIPINRGIIRENIQEYIINAKEEHKWNLQEIKRQKRLNLH